MVYGNLLQLNKLFCVFSLLYIMVAANFLKIQAEQGQAEQGQADKVKPTPYDKT
jgi:hypothetical protein